MKILSRAGQIVSNPSYLQIPYKNPSDVRFIPSAEWAEANAGYYGTPSPACAPYVGRALPGGSGSRNT